MARTARRDVIGLLIERRVSYTEREADALTARAKVRSRASGRTVRAEAELLLSGDRETRLHDLRNAVAEVGRLLATITVQADDLRAESDEDDEELAAVLSELRICREEFTSGAVDDPTSN